MSMSPPAAGAPTGTAGTGAGTGMMAASGTGAAGMAAMAGMNGGAGTGAIPPSSSCGPATTVAAADLGNVKNRGPWTPAMKASSGPGGRSTLFYPMELGKDGVTHPVFHWGCGAGSQPSQYADHLSQLASHGVVVIANASGSMPGKASLDWLLAENEKADSMFHQKLDPMRVGAGGHSLGSLETFQMASDPRLNLYVLVCGGTMGGASKAGDIHGPSIYLGGKGESGTTNYERNDWPVTKGDSVFVKHSTTDHIQCARDNLAPWVAFTRWHFCGEPQWKADFMPNGTFCKSPWEACEMKGF